MTFGGCLLVLQFECRSDRTLHCIHARYWSTSVCPVSLPGTPVNKGLVKAVTSVKAVVTVRTMCCLFMEIPKRVYWNWNNLFEQTVDLTPQIAYLNQSSLDFKFLSQRADLIASVNRSTRTNYQVFWRVVRFVLVQVMNNFTGSELTIDAVFGHHPMQIHSFIGHRFCD